MRRFRNVIAIAGLLAVAIALLFAVTRWPIEDDRRPSRAALWDDPLPPELAAALRAGGVEPVEWPGGEGWPDPLVNQEVDLLLNYEPPGALNGVAIGGGSLDMEYDAQRRSSLVALERADGVMQSYNMSFRQNRRPEVSVHRHAVGMDDPESWHFFFGALTPLLVLAALGLGAGLGGSRWRRVARAEVFVLVLALGLNYVVPFFHFRTTPTHSITFYWYAVVIPLIPAFLAGLAFPPAISIGLALPPGRARWLRIALATVAAAALALAVANLLDLDTSSWPTSRAPNEITLPALVICALASSVIAQIDGSWERLPHAERGGEGGH
jgi:4-amino-4-deoxy-L-arabinose transferase-like glycosyltransferase